MPEKRSLKQQIEQLETDLEIAEGEIEEAQREYDRIERKLEDLKNRRDAGCPRCEIKQELIEGNICCPYCGYCEFVADGIAEECPEHAMEVVA